MDQVERALLVVSGDAKSSNLVADSQVTFKYTMHSLHGLQCFTQEGCMLVHQVAGRCGVQAARQPVHLLLCAFAVLCK